MIKRCRRSLLGRIKKSLTQNFGIYQMRQISCCGNQFHKAALSMSLYFQTQKIHSTDFAKNELVKVRLESK